MKTSFSISLAGPPHKDDPDGAEQRAQHTVRHTCITLENVAHICSKLDAKNNLYFVLIHLCHRTLWLSFCGAYGLKCFETTLDSNNEEILLYTSDSRFKTLPCDHRVPKHPRITRLCRREQHHAPPSLNAAVGLAKGRPVTFHLYRGLFKPGGATEEYMFHPDLTFVHSLWTSVGSNFRNLRP